MKTCVIVATLADGGLGRETLLSKLLGLKLLDGFLSANNGSKLSSSTRSPRVIRSGVGTGSFKINLLLFF